jgi:uncharacterized membrane protein YsdA (DUF1294 family)/cold shock CspA family protein
MKYRGTIANWNDDKGFGFIRPAGGGTELFFHISDYRGAGRPSPGDRVNFMIGTGRNGKPAASGVQPAFSRIEQGPSQTAHYSIDSVRVYLALAVLALALACAILDRAPIQLTLLYMAFGAISYGQYWFDKKAAQAERRRIAESRLHLVDAALGIAGGLLAQQVLRHKTAKPQFAFVSYAIAGLHIFCLAGISLGLLPVDEFLAAAGR